MKFEIAETTHWSQVTLTPENIKEQNQLLRIVNNSKAKTVTLSVSFSGDSSDLSIFIGKVNQKVQKNSINKKL